MIRARLTLPVNNKQTALPLMKAVEPDNRIPRLAVVGKIGDKQLTFVMKFDGGVETFISTLDDMLRCLQAAQETLDKIERKELE